MSSSRILLFTLAALLCGVSAEAQQREIEALRARVERVERAAASGRLSAKAGE
jgi:hypothetical protein